MDEELKQKVNEALAMYGDEFVMVLRDLIKEDDLVASGNLLNSIELDLDQNEVNILAAEYFEHVDQGRPPGDPPPLNEILQWTDLKGIEREAAFPIAKHIGKFGVPAHNLIQRAMKRTNDDLKEKLEEKGAEGIQQFLNKQIKESGAEIK